MLEKVNKYQFLHNILWPAYKTNWKNIVQISSKISRLRHEYFYSNTFGNNTSKHTNGIYSHISWEILDEIWTIFFLLNLSMGHK